MRPINEMTDDELRREIAERLGWTVKFDHTFNDGDNIMWQVSPPSGFTGYVMAYVQTYSRRTIDDAWWGAILDTSIIPLWTVDVEVALDLCMTIGARRTPREVAGVVYLGSLNPAPNEQLYYAAYMLVPEPEDVLGREPQPFKVSHFATGDAAAQALARLALSALRSRNRL